MHDIMVNLITLIPICSIMLMLIFNPVINKSKKKYYLLALKTVLIESILQIITILNNYNTASAKVISMLVNAFGFALAPAVLFFLICSVTHNTRYQKYEKFLLAPILINAFFSFLSINYHFFFNINSESVYSRGRFFGTQILLNLMYLIIFLVCDLHKNRRYLNGEKIWVVVCTVISVFGIMIQSINADYVIIWGTISVAMIIYHINFLNNLLKHDELTNLLTRRMYKMSLTKINKRKSAVIINIDVNSFKTINDSYGHSFGDTVLKECARNIQYYFVDYGFAYRTGGDEFAVICNDINQKQIEYTFKCIEDSLIPISQKIGIKKLLAYGYNMYTPQNDNDIYQSEKLADELMYKNKTQFKLE